MANDTEGKLVDLWNREEESTGLKGWMEENVSRKGLSKLYNKAAEYQKEKMAEEVIPGLTQGQLYEGISGNIGGFAKILNKKGVGHIIEKLGIDSDEIILAMKQTKKSKFLTDVEKNKQVKRFEERLSENMTIQVGLIEDLLYKDPKLLKDVAKEWVKMKK